MAQRKGRTQEIWITVSTSAARTSTALFPPICSLPNTQLWGVGVLNQASGVPLPPGKVGTTPTKDRICLVQRPVLGSDLPRGSGVVTGKSPASAPELEKQALPCPLTGVGRGDEMG